MGSSNCNYLVLFNVHWHSTIQEPLAFHLHWNATPAAAIKLAIFRSAAAPLRWTHVHTLNPFSNGLHCTAVYLKEPSNTLPSNHQITSKKKFIGSWINHCKNFWNQPSTSWSKRFVTRCNSFPSYLAQMSVLDAKHGSMAQTNVVTLASWPWALFL